MKKWKTVSKTYVVHIYRYDRDDPANIIGTVEDVEKSVRQPFSGAEELYKLVCPAASPLKITLPPSAPPLKIRGGKGEL